MSATSETPGLAGKVVGGRYRVLEQIGSDESGTVWRGKDEQGGADVVVRVPDARLLADAGFGERLRKRATEAAPPHVARVLAVVDHEGVPCVVAEHLGGGSLADRFRERSGPFTLEEVLRWLPEAAAALDGLHRAGVVHRRIRPDSVLFDPGGRVALSDCALALAGASAAGPVPDSARPYAPPEAGGVAAPTPAYDQYGLGALAYHALSGKPPSRGGGSGTPAPIGGSVSDAVSAAVLRALEADPSRRYPSCAALAGALRSSATTAAAAAPAAKEKPTSKIVPPAAAVASPTGEEGSTRRLPSAAERRATGPATGGRKPSKKKLYVGLLVAVVAIGIGVVAVMAALEPPPPPKLAITDPPDGHIVTAREVVVRGTFTGGQKDDKVAVQDVVVPVIDGKFERPVPLVQEGRQALAVEVKAGEAVRARKTVTVNYRAAWRPIIDDARRAADAKDWEKARTKLEEARKAGILEPDVPVEITMGIAKWEEPPDLALSQPAPDTVLSEPRVMVRGTFSSNRSTDRVLVDGKPVEVRDGAFDGVVQGLRSGQPKEILVVVDDRGTVRKRASVTVTYQKPPEVWEAFLQGWAAPEGSDVDAAGYPKKIRRTKDGAVMVLVPGGKFRRGAVAKSRQALPSEKPPNDVTLTKAFYVDETEVTVGTWKKFVADGLGQIPNLSVMATKDTSPVYNVTHDEASAFARWNGTNLPTEAQWERAAKGGHDDYVYPWGHDDDPKKRNVTGTTDDYERLAPVKSYPPNDYGLYDMAGNVWEWCSDWYDEKYYVASPPADPAGPETGEERSVKGGGWDKEGYVARTSYRMGLKPSSRSVHLGFRCAKTLP